MIVVDTGPLVAALDADDADHKRCLDLLEHHSGPLLVPAPVLTALGPAGAGKATGEQTLARTLYPRFQADWLVTADRNFYNWADLVRGRRHR
ncbi:MULTISPECIES: hypothetical protein [unclassified Frankia]|uniref:hypothetical protein n=1 Tax=unclassified Frankia TaxID=2632575 RepID=UPI002AD477A0|nr:MULTISPECIES: hypothetical protein [unclassified Frankia]